MVVGVSPKKLSAAEEGEGGWKMEEQEDEEESEMLERSCMMMERSVKNLESRVTFGKLLQGLGRVL